ncbi:MAG: CDP-diacylglycerol--serine O-phosphatidyltransferase [Phascolarctobacterium sp.]|nr:CDP-diacylglycerol--serine O-phosphatidyltransferase [Phascolarctobacterium sp.]
MSHRRIAPNSVSVLSLIFGVLSIFMTIEKNFSCAALFIILAVVADSIDGRIARLLGVSGEFGKELDSLCDLASFGVAPAILIYQYAMPDIGVPGMNIAALFTASGAMRLARFNINSAEVKGYFQGMPIPAGACFLATYVLSGYSLSSFITAVMTLIIAVIMYSSIKFPDFKGKGTPLCIPPVIATLLLGIYMLYECPSAWPFAVMLAYTVAGVFNHFYTLFMHK